MRCPTFNQYKYSSCIRLSGARVVPTGPDDYFDLDAMLEAVGSRTACIFTPAHLLDGFNGVARLRELAQNAQGMGVPVVVDAAYMSYPVDLLSQYASAGADLTCVSAKYFGRPNSGGFVSGRRGLIQAVEGLDFTCFESGRYRSFGRTFKMSRYDVAATALALRSWVNLDHGARWKGYADKVACIAAAVRSAPGPTARGRLFTMSEELRDSDQVNCLVLSFGRDAVLRPIVARTGGRSRTGCVAEQHRCRAR